ncbi:MAG: response regulator transcription factor [Pyrinomonadaceae bacterium]|nr:response regulator transcription factor [Pyrinomonadaceae bacterium]
MKNKIKIITADDHPIFRRGLCSVIETDSNLEIIGEAGNGEEVLQILQTQTADVVILDINMPGMDGIATARVLHRDFPKIKMIFLTLEKDREIVNALKTLKVKGYLLKDSAVLEIVNCINQVVAGRIFISPEITDLLMSSLEEESVETDKILLISKLTPTETRILRLMADSKTNKEIAEELFISVRTAENHRANMCNKLNLSGNHSLFKFALENKELILKKDSL